MIINLFEDKIEEILDKHNVAASDYDKLKTDLVDAFISSHLTSSKRLATPPKTFTKYMEKEKIEKSGPFYRAFYKWVTKTEEGEKWLCSVLGITKDILTTDIAIQYMQTSGKVAHLKPLQTTIYYRVKPKQRTRKKKDS